MVAPIRQVFEVKAALIESNTMLGLGGSLVVRSEGPPEDSSLILV